MAIIHETPTDPARPEAMAGEATFLMWRLLANGRTDLWEHTIRESYRLSIPEEREVERHEGVESEREWAR